MTRDRHIVAILPRGEAIRNFVYSGALDGISDRAALTVLSVIPNAQIDELLRARYERVLELNDVPERLVVGAARELLDMAHGRWLWSEAARIRWRVRDGEATTVRLKTKRLLKKAACYPFANAVGLRMLSRVERRLSRWFRTSEEFVKMFRLLNPSLVFNGSHSHSPNAIQAVQAAQWLGIRTATFIFSWDNLTSQGRVIPPYDYYLVWNEDLRDQLLEMYPAVRPDRVFVTGTPQFDVHLMPRFHWTREEFCARIGADPRRPIVLYTTGMPVPQLGEPRIVQGLAGMLARMTDVGPPQLVLRVYPKDRTGRFDELKRTCPDVLFADAVWEPNWYTPLPEDAYMLTNSLRHADVGINVASTISLELCMFGKPVLNVAYDPPGVDIRPYQYRRFYDFDHYSPVVKSGAIGLAYSEPEMATLIRRALANPGERRAQQFALMTRMFGNTLDGRSGERIADSLVEIAHRCSPQRSIAGRLFQRGVEGTVQP